MPFALLISCGVTPNFAAMSYRVSPGTTVYIVRESIGAAVGLAGAVNVLVAATVLVALSVPFVVTVLVTLGVLPAVTVLVGTADAIGVGSDAKGLANAIGVDSSELGRGELS